MNWGNGGRTFFILAVATTLCYSNAQANNLNPRCLKENPNAEFVVSEDHKWGYSMAELKQHAKNMYEGEKQIKERAYYNKEKGSFMLPYDSLDSKNEIKLTQQFIDSVTKHIEIALRLRYADAVMFPDMGHSHLYIPQKVWDEKLKPLSDDMSKGMAPLYEAMLAEPSIRALYHTAEQLKMTTGYGEGEKLIQDRELMQRYFTRNPVGNNLGKQASMEIWNHPDFTEFNTVRGQKGYFLWSAGYIIHANKNACFPYKHNGKIYYFDISLKDISPDPKGEHGGYY